MTDVVGTCTGAFVEVPSSSRTDYEGFVLSKINGVPEYHWIRIQGMDPKAGSPVNARLEVSPSLEHLLGGSVALGQVCARLRSAPSVSHFLEDLQDVLERLSYSSSGAGPGPRSCGAGGGDSSSSSSSSIMQLLLRDLDELGWGCLEELDQDTARMTLLHVDEQGREHRLRLALPYDYPTSPPVVATDLPAPFIFTWRPPSLPLQPYGTTTASGVGDCVGGPGNSVSTGNTSAACSSLADVYKTFVLVVAQYQPLWYCLDDLDRRTRVLDPPPSVSASRRHVGVPSRRLALGAAASLQLRLEPADPRGPPPPGGVAFLGPPDSVAPLRESFFGRLHLWSRDSNPVDNLELLLGQRLPAPHRGGDRGGGDNNAKSGQMGLITGNGQYEQQAEDTALAMAECPICMMHILPVDEDGVEADDNDNYNCDDGGKVTDMAEAAAARVDEVGGIGGARSSRGLVPDVVCPTPACGLAFHTPCLAEWLRSLPDTRVSFSKLFGRCPFCSNPITVRA